MKCEQFHRNKPRNTWEAGSRINKVLSHKTGLDAR